MNNTTHTLFHINRELRRVPLACEHPTDNAGSFIPLRNRRERTTEALAGYAADGFTAEEIEGFFMPDFSQVPEEQMGVQAYETTSEGTPISPVFPDTAEGRCALVEYCAKHETIFGPTKTADETTWVKILFGERDAVVDLRSGTVELLRVSEPIN